MVGNKLLMNKFLKFIKFSELTFWTAKRYFITDLKLTNKYPQVLFGKFLAKYSSKIINIEDEKVYKIIGVRSYGKGAYINREVQGQSLNMKKYQLVEPNLLLWCKVDTKNGAFGIVTKNLAPSYASSNMALAKINNNLIANDYLQLLFTCPQFHKYLDLFVSGTTNRKYIKIDELLTKIKIPLPSLEKQKEIVDRYNEKIKLAEEQEKEAQNLEQEINKYIFSELGLKIKKDLKRDKLLNFVNFSNLKLWGVDKICGTNRFYSEIYKLHSLNDTHDLYIEAFRGKSPKYENNGNSIILNQKCNRWNLIDLNFAKTVSESWANSIDNNFKTQEGDILINSTGEGTIGRASCISKENIGLLYDSHILLLRLNKQKINPLYYTYLFNSCFGQEQIDFVKSAQSTKQTELGIDNLKKIKFPYPDMDVQNEIVDTITKLKAKIEKLNNLAEQNRQLAQEEFEKELFE